MFIVEWFYCPDGIIPDTGLTGQNNNYIHWIWKSPVIFGVIDSYQYP